MSSPGPDKPKKSKNPGESAPPGSGDPRASNLTRVPKRLILAVDDDQDNLTLIRKTLEYDGYRVATSQSSEDALEKLKNQGPDLVLLDINLPGMSGLDALKRIRQSDPLLSVIFVSARNDTHDIVRGLDAGADDYVSKPFEPLELLARVRAQLRVKELTEKLAAANTRLQELVDIDDLTGLYNMRSVYQRLDNEIARAKRYGRAVAVVMMDMDDFKQVNDSHDHLFGSFVLTEVGKLIRNTVRSMDFAARYGGDEFLIVLSETTVDGAAIFCERLRKAIANHTFTKDSDSMQLAASLGVAAVEPAVTPIDAKTLVRYADHALYEAKRAGKNRVMKFDWATIEVKTPDKKSS